MSLSTSTIATLLIAGTAIGGSAAAVVITNSPVSADQQNQLQVVQPNTNTSISTNSQQKIASGGKVTTIEPNAVKSSVVSPTPTPTSTPITPVDPVLPPVPGFGGGSNGGDDNGRGDDGNGDDNNSGYSHHSHHQNDDNEGSDD
jgi:hypothetical protein